MNVYNSDSSAAFFLIQEIEDMLSWEGKEEDFEVLYNRMYQKKLDELKKSYPEEIVQDFLENMDEYFVRFASIGKNAENTRIHYSFHEMI